MCLFMSEEYILPKVATYFLFHIFHNFSNFSHLFFVISFRRKRSLKRQLLIIAESQREDFSL